MFVPDKQFAACALPEVSCRTSPFSATSTVCGPMVGSTDDSTDSDIPRAQVGQPRDTANKPQNCNWQCVKVTCLKQKS